MAQLNGEKLVRFCAGLTVGSVFAVIAHAAPAQEGSIGPQSQKIDTVLDDHKQHQPRKSMYEMARQAGYLNHGPSMGRVAAEACLSEKHQRRRSIIAYQFDRSTRLEFRMRGRKAMLMFKMNLDNDMQPYNDHKVHCEDPGTGVQGALGSLYRHLSEQDQRGQRPPPAPDVLP